MTSSVKLRVRHYGNEPNGRDERRSPRREESGWMSGSENTGLSSRRPESVSRELCDIVRYLFKHKAQGAA